jgi:hypothetical protein
MNDAGATETGLEESGRAGRASGGGQTGVVHTFVELGELRRIMGRLAAIELLRMMLDTTAAA